MMLTLSVMARPSLYLVMSVVVNSSFFYSKVINRQSPVVQSIISLTSSFMVKMLTVLVSTISN